MIGGAILAGGAARRLGGRPKGLAPVGGVRIVDHLRAVLVQALGHEPILIANDPDAPNWDTHLRVVRDRLPGFGALSGLHAALSEHDGPVVCLAWDMPFVTTALVALLAEAIVGTDAVLPESGGPRGAEPLAAAYGPACRGAIEAAIRRGDHRAIGFHDAVQVRILDASTVAQAGDPARLFFNVNTAHDLSEAEALWRASSAS